MIGPLLLDADKIVASEDARAAGRVLEAVVHLARHNGALSGESGIAEYEDALFRLTLQADERARQAMSLLLTDLSLFPIRLTTLLAADDAVTVASPILTAALCLEDRVLIDCSTYQSLDHRVAIAKRSVLSEPVTEVLVDRSEHLVLRTVVNNLGARFSQKGFSRIIDNAAADESLALAVAARSDLPRHHFVRLVAVVPVGLKQILGSRFLGENVSATSAISVPVTPECLTPSDQQAAFAAFDRDYGEMVIDEHAVECAARQHHVDAVAVMLSRLGQTDFHRAREIIADSKLEPLLILARAAGLSWATTRLILSLRNGGLGSSMSDIDHAIVSFERIKPTIAKQVLALRTNSAIHNQTLARS
ncbi:MAG: DUF2336 domain-containing protein [Alphaproteobacteria bacterium]